MRVYLVIEDGTPIAAHSTRARAEQEAKVLRRDGGERVHVVTLVMEVD